MACKPNFVAEGWNLLHEAALRVGAEIDYDPLIEPELGFRTYLSESHYCDLLGPVTTLPGLDYEALGLRANLIRRAIWRWIRRTAMSKDPKLWVSLTASRSRTQLISSFADILRKRRFPKAPSFQASYPPSVVKCAYWLLYEVAQKDRQPIVPIILGLALIAGAMRGKPKRGYCKYCFRNASLGSQLCAFHRQGDVHLKKRSAAATRYRIARRAAELAAANIDPATGQHPKDVFFFRKPFFEHLSRNQVLAEILFPMQPLEGWGAEYQRLKIDILSTPNVLKLIGGRKSLKLSFEQLADRLRERLDPFEFDDFQWKYKIFFAERWLALEAQAAPLIRGKGKATQAKVAIAADLATQGLRNGQIARKLDVSPAAVSRWRDRYPDFDVACAKRDRHQCKANTR